MLGFSGKNKAMKPKKAREIIEYVASELAEFGEIPDVQHLTELDEVTRSSLLRRLYLDAESRVVRRSNSKWSSAAELRGDIAKRYKIGRAMPSGFTVLFNSPSSQMFWLFKSLLGELWKRAEWDAAHVISIINDTAQGGPLSEMSVLSEASWYASYAAFKKVKEGEREASVVDAFKRVINRSFRDFIKDRGESRARIALEEIGRAINKDFGTLDVIAEVMQALPEGILAEERIAYGSREELQKTVMRQMQELRGKNMALIAEAKQLHETIQTLENSRAEAVAMTKAQQDFIQVVMHQFRTPLAALRWQGEALSEFVIDHPELEGLKSVADVIRQRSSFLVGQLENIFDLLTLQSGGYKLNLQVVNLESELKSICKEFAKDAERRGIALTCSAGGAPSVQADADAIHRVLRILLTNAMQFSEKGGSVSISHEVVRRGEGEGEARIHIKDQGIGIRPDDRPKLFTKFFRAKNAIAKAPDGAGIAAFIAKRIVELHGGRMWANSAGSDEGATFSFSLPVKKEAPKALPNHSSVPASAGMPTPQPRSAPAPATPPSPEPAPAPASTPPPEPTQVSPTASVSPARPAPIPTTPPPISTPAPAPEQAPTPPPAPKQKPSKPPVSQPDIPDAKDPLLDA